MTTEDVLDALARPADVPPRAFRTVATWSMFTPRRSRLMRKASGSPGPRSGRLRCSSRWSPTGGIPEGWETVIRDARAGALWTNDYRLLLC